MIVKEKIEPEDIRRTQKKFEVWDKIDKKNNLQFSLLLDPTIWAYAYLKDKQNNPLKLRPYQDLVINDKNRFVLFVAANQIGKTWTLCVKGVHHAIHVPNSTVLIGSKSEPQAIRVLDETKQMLNRSDIKFNEIYSEVANRTELTFNQPHRNIGKLVCVPATERALGYDATLTLLDEFAFWENDDYLYEKVFETRSLETKKWKYKNFTMGQNVIISNPNGAQGKFYDLYRHDSRYNKYRFNWLIAPGNTIEEYNRLKEIKDPDTFDMCYAAVFTSGRDSFITYEQYKKAIESVVMPTNKPLYLGLDVAGEDIVGKHSDSSVLFAGYVEKKDLNNLFVPYWKEFKPGTAKKEIYNEIALLKKSYTVYGIAYDKPGVGDSIKNDLIDEHIFPEYQINSLTYSLPNKTDVYVNLKRLYEQGRIKHPDIPKLKEQLMGLKMVRTAGGHLDKATGERKASYKIHHRSQNLHDDFPDALANLAWKALRATSPEPTMTLIERKKVKKSDIPKKKLAICPICKEAHWVEGFKEHYEKEIVCPVCEVKI